MSTTILRIPRSGHDNDEFVIVRVEQNDSSRLDLYFCGTDGESPFVTRVKHSVVEKLKNKAFTGTLDEWQTVLFALFTHREESLNQDVVKDVELVSTVDDSLTIIIRKNIDGITQRLGEVTLQRKEDEEISLLDWTAESAKTVAELQRKNLELQAELKKTQGVRDDLKTKQSSMKEEQGQSEHQMLQKFAALLNTKKARIRSQQRKLMRAGLKTNDDDDDDDENENGNMHKSKGDAKSSTGRKRKAITDDDSGKDDAEEEADSDVDDNAKRHDEDATTTDGTNDLESQEAESQDEHESSVSNRKDTSRTNKSPGQKVKKEVESQPVKGLRIPPKRDLPFLEEEPEKPSTRSQKAGDGDKERTINDGRDSSTDDEL